MPQNTFTFPYDFKQKPPCIPNFEGDISAHVINSTIFGFIVTNRNKNV